MAMANFLFVQLCRLGFRFPLQPFSCVLRLGFFLSFERLDVPRNVIYARGDGCYGRRVPICTSMICAQYNNTIAETACMHTYILGDADCTIVCRLGSGCLKAFLFPPTYYTRTSRRHPRAFPPSRRAMIAAHWVAFWFFMCKGLNKLTSRLGNIQWWERYPCIHSVAIYHR